MIEQPAIDIADELRIPLPASREGSVYEEDGDEVEGDDPVAGEIGAQRGLLVADQALETGNQDAIGLDGEEQMPKLPERELVSPEPMSGPSMAAVHTLPEELVQIIRLEGHQTYRFMSLQNRVQELIHHCGIVGRLIPRQAHLYRLMVNAFRTDDSTTFASLYSKAVKAKESCVYRPNSIEYSPKGHSPLRPLTALSESWIHTLPATVQQAILDLLHSIRCDPTFLASRITNLSSVQLKRLAQPHRSSPLPDSMLPTTSPYRFAQSSASVNLPKPKEESISLESLEQDPLLLLLHGVFDPSSGPESEESRCQLDVWSTTCAMLLEAGLPGCDQFCMTILDNFANMHPWPLKTHLEFFLAELIQTGAFLLEPAASPPVDFSKPAELQEDRNVALSEYFERALDTLTDLLTGSSGSDGVPRGAADLIQATIWKIESAQRRIKAQGFFIRWYCTSFISNVLKFPESLGIMMNCHISDATRHKIFGGLAQRLQKGVLDALSQWGPSRTTGPAHDDGFLKIIHIFDPPRPNHIPHAPVTKRDPTSLDESPLEYLMLSPNDVLSIAKVLYPEEHSLPTPPNSFYASPFFSTASSITGSSTVTSSSDEPRTGTSSSTAASVSGTSITSNGSSSRVLTAGMVDTPKTSVSDGDVPLVTGGPSKADACAPSVMILALARVIPASQPFNTSSGLYHRTGSPFYLERVSERIKTKPGSFESPLRSVNSLVKTLATLEMDDDAISENDLMLLVDSVVSVSQDNRIFSAARDQVSGSLFEICFRDRYIQSKSQYDFQGAHIWWRSLQILSRFSLGMRATIFENIRKICTARMDFCNQWIRHFEARILELQRRQEAQESALQAQAREYCKLRDKMWYLSGVRHSAVYSEALNVTQALTKMSKSVQQKTTGVAAWARQRLRSSIGLDRAQQQTLEVLAAPKNHGGPSKLSDTQAELTSRWLTRRSVENFCKGEERIHRFCLEIQKCVDKLVGETLLESPVLWSSSLYQEEKQHYGVGRGQPKIQPVRDVLSLGRNSSLGSFSPSAQNMPSNFTRSLNSPSKPYMGGLGISQDPNLYFMDESLFNSAAYPTPLSSNMPYFGEDSYITSSQPWMLPPSPISPERVSRSRSTSQSTSEQKSEFLSHMREVVTSLLLSELGASLWNDGSETDCWITKAKFLRTSNVNVDRKRKATEEIPPLTSSYPRVEFDLPPHPRAIESELSPHGIFRAAPPSPAGTVHQVTSSDFNFEDAYKKLISKFRFSPSPYEKLETLHDLSTLITLSQERQTQDSLSFSETLGPDILSIPRDPKSPAIRPIGVPRTRLNRLEEVIANCEDRRLNSLRSISDHGRPSTFTDWTQLSSYAGSTNPHLDGTLQRILSDPSLRPHALFRDLQFIAAFVPASVLDNTPQGTTFWTIGLAAVSLKADLTKEMTLRANQIVAAYYNRQSKRENACSATEPRRNSLVAARSGYEHAANAEMEDPTLEATTLADAAKLYTLAALEGDPTAARELALFHLTHPELVSRVTLPLSRPSEVFSPHANFTGETRFGRAGGKGGLDPMTFAVAFHWMEVAANAGDGDARGFLRENGDLGRGW